jgi:hypothetical protein
MKKSYAFIFYECMRISFICSHQIKWHSISCSLSSYFFSPFFLVFFSYLSQLKRSLSGIIIMTDYFHFFSLTSFVTTCCAKSIHQRWNFLVISLSENYMVSNLNILFLTNNLRWVYIMQVAPRRYSFPKWRTMNHVIKMTTSL